MKKFALLSDLHIGGLASPWPQKFIYQEPGGRDQSFTLNQTQKAFWMWWMKFVNGDAKEADAILVDGDLCHGNERKSEGMHTVTSDLAAQEQACLFMLRMLPKETPIYITQGTPYHTMENRPLEQHIAESLPNAEFGRDLVIEECGIRMYARHFINVSTTTWQYRTTPAARDMLLLAVNEAQDKYGKIDFAAFGHAHYFTSASFTSMIAAILPCWQSRTAYAVKRGIISPPDCGWVTLKIENRRCMALDRNNIFHIEKPCKVVGRDRK